MSTCSFRNSDHAGKCRPGRYSPTPATISGGNPPIETSKSNPTMIHQMAEALVSLQCPISLSKAILSLSLSLSLSVNLSDSFVFCGSISDLVRYRMCETSGESQRRIWEFSDVPNRVGEIGCGETVFVSEGLIGSRRRCGDQFRYHNLTLSIFMYMFELNKKTYGFGGIEVWEIPVIFDILMCCKVLLWCIKFWLGFYLIFWAPRTIWG